MPAARSFATPWIAPGLVAVGLLCSFAPGLPEALEYDRGAVGRGEIWRLVTGQLVHWTPRMTLVDLGVLLALGVWLERRSPRLLVVASLLAAVLVAVGVQLATPELARYRGSSGVATALFVALACRLARDRESRPASRALALVALLLFCVKVVLESRGVTVAAGELPEGVRVTPVVHVAGAIAGLAAAVAVGPRPTPPARHDSPIRVTS